jgi:CheY-like chemotaxis protein
MPNLNKHVVAARQARYRRRMNLWNAIAGHVVLISAYPDREFHRQGLEAGAAAFLDKKISIYPHSARSWMTSSPQPAWKG